MKPNETGLSKLEGYAKTKEEVSTLLGELVAVRDGLYKSGGVEEVLGSEVRAGVAEALREELQKSEDKDQLLAGMIEKLRATEYLELEVARELSEESLRRIGEAVRARVGGGVALDVRVDSGVVAGARIVYKGKMGDYSLAKLGGKLEEKQNEV